MNNFLVTSGGAAVVASLIIQYLKKSNLFTFLSIEAHSANANQLFSILVAIVTSLGLTFTFNSAQHTLVIGGLDFSSMFTLGYHALGQWIAQHVAYKTIVVPTEMQAKQMDLQNQQIDMQKLLLSYLQGEKK